MEKQITRQETIYTCAAACGIPESKKQCHKCESKKTETTMYFNDGTKMPIGEYRKSKGLPEKASPKVDKPPKYSADAMKIREPIISEIIKYDLSTGMKYSKTGGFLRDKNGNYQFDEPTARETLAYFTTKELQHIAKEMPTLKAGSNN